MDKTSLVARVFTWFQYYQILSQTDQVYMIFATALNSQFVKTDYLVSILEIADLSACLSASLIFSNSQYE